MAAPLALTMGEPGGIGPEITAAAWRATRLGGAPFIYIGDDALISPYAPTQQIDAPINAAEVFKTAIPVLPGVDVSNVTIGEADSRHASAVTKSIEMAIALAKDGDVAGVVTNPIQKSTLLDAGFAFPGHTEFLAALCAQGEHAPRSVMMIAGPELRTVPVTVHQSVVDAAKTLSSELIVDTARIVQAALRTDFGVENPRLAVSGLNPHAGEDGALGLEDKTIIAPAIELLNQEGVACVGPLPADAMFNPRARRGYDAALCMLHDQALIPVKTISFDEAVNVTLGLPIVRTSPDHGTALDIAGKGVARADSLIASIELAADMAFRRDR